MSAVVVPRRFPRWPCSCFLKKKKKTIGGDIYDIVSVMIEDEEFPVALFYSFGNQSTILVSFLLRF